MAKPPVVASLTWNEELSFSASSGSQQLIIDGQSKAGPSPVQALAFGIAGCMGIDVIDILRKGRHPVRGLEIALTAERAETPPHRLTTVHLVFTVAGDVPSDAVKRAIGLSHEKYCSVSNSLRGDIRFTTEFEVHP